MQDDFLGRCFSAAFVPVAIVIVVVTLLTLALWAMSLPLKALVTASN